MNAGTTWKKIELEGSGRPKEKNISKNKHNKTTAYKGKSSWLSCGNPKMAIRGMVVARIARVVN